MLRFEGYGSLLLVLMLLFLITGGLRLLLYNRLIYIGCKCALVNKDKLFEVSARAEVLRPILGCRAKLTIRGKSLVACHPAGFTLHCTVLSDRA